MNSHVTDEATTGVVAVVRPRSSSRVTSNEAASMRPTRTQVPVFAALNDGSGLSFTAGSLTAQATFDRKAVITQDPYHPVSGKQFWSHPPV